MAQSLQRRVENATSPTPRFSPVAKLALLLAAIVLLTAASHAASIATGVDLSLLNKNGGTVVLLLTALVGLLGIVATQGQPMADYGIVVDRHWLRRGLTGIALGICVYGGYVGVCVALGVFDLRFDSISLSRVAKSALATMSSLPLATVQQIIFAGLLMGLLRPQLGRVTAVTISAAAFGLAVAAGVDSGIFSPPGCRLLIAMTLLATLLGGLRLASGSIVLPAGVLAGAIMVRRATSKLRLLDYNAEAAWAEHLAPAGDPRQGIPFVVLLVSAAIAVTWWIARRGESLITSDPQADATFKRMNPFSNLLTFIPLDRWLVLLTTARSRVGMLYLPRLAITLIGSAIGTLLALPERLLAPLLCRHEVPSPVFVVGIHRSGTTHLHNLLSLDPQFRAPRNYEVFNPLGFLTGWITTALMTPALMWRRPMDSVQMTPFSSQEEEFALAAMGSPSPYAAFCMPKELRQHWRFMHAESFTPRALARWMRDYRLFLRKITWFRRRPPLLKNPANTGRISLLKRMFPNAKFVYLVRHPDDVYRSNLHFAEQGLVVLQLQDPDANENYATEFLENYRRVSVAAERDLAELDDRQGVRLRFEDVEADPIAAIAQLYETLDLEFTFEFRRKLDDYVARNAGYRKNRQHALPADQARAVRRAMGPFYATWGYEDAVPERRAA